jgi:tRNA(fMet)-specific endonuclease VapC
MTWFLLDTNHLSEAIRPVSRVRDRLQQSRLDGHVFGVCVPILCELEVGIQQTAEPDEYRQRLRELSRHIRIWPLERDLVPLFAEVVGVLRQRGRVLGQIDMLIAALCRHKDLKLLTADRDFEALPEIRTENWMVGPSAEVES